MGLGEWINESEWDKNRVSLMQSGNVQSLLHYKNRQNIPLETLETGFLGNEEESIYSAPAQN